MNIIEKVNSPSSWVSPVVVVPKPNGGSETLRGYEVSELCS